MWNCKVKIFACVVNWFDVSMYLDQADYQNIMDRLEEESNLQGVDGVLFITKNGEEFMFLNETGKHIDW